MTLKLITDFPIAYESYDHQMPKGTMHDNTHHVPFVERIEEMAEGRKLIFADLGCSGGGLVKDFIDRGHEAIGIEGSDYSQRNKRAEWATIPDHLHTADITKPFFISDENRTAGICDVITAWDVMEHITENDLNGLLANIRNNLKVGGLFVCSIATFPDEPHHVTLKEEPWWVDKFAKFKLVKLTPPAFDESHMGRQSSFYLVLQKV